MSKNHSIVPNVLSLDHTSCKDEDNPYRPDSLPGARDVHSPWGNMRAYEWGPEDGRKVLFLHGLSTPGPALGSVAKVLAGRGCRVLVIDLWGRGYSDCPSDLEHDLRLYATQILLAISTSSLSWTGSDGGFSLVGYSMGGALAVSFASYSPQLVSSVVLIAPGGLRDSLSPEYRSFPLRFPGIFPNMYLKRLVRTLLNGPDKRAKDKQPKLQEASRKLDANQWPEEVQRQDELDVRGIVDWEIDYHKGFIFSVTSALKHAPIIRQYGAWRRLGYHIQASRQMQPSAGTWNKLQGQRVLLLLGNQDPLLPYEEIRSKAASTLGSSNVEIIEFEGGHAFPITQGELVANTICAFWRLPRSELRHSNYISKPGDG